MFILLLSEQWRPQADIIAFISLVSHSHQEKGYLAFRKLTDSVSTPFHSPYSTVVQGATSSERIPSWLTSRSSTHPLRRKSFPPSR